MQRIGFMAAVALALGALPASGADKGETSPSETLRKVDATLGSQPVSFQSGQESAGEDRTLAPYFYVGGSDSDTERLPLEETRADVHIAGVIARVRVYQTFRNTGSKPIEAVYVFPASTRAAVHGMRMRIGERTVEARIEKREAARRQYEQARQEGKRASLLQQERPNVFTMSVANVMPRDRIQVELDYSEILLPEEATYEFVYPAVVGPRYGGGSDPKRDRWIASPYLTEGEAEPYQFGIKVHVESGISLKELSSPSHAISVSYRSKNSADVSLAQPGGGNKDFVLRYRLAGDQVETGLLLWQGEQENFFLLMMEPPQRPAGAQIPPREYLFLLDISGSMHGFPLETSKALMRNLFSQLHPTDYFNIATFAGGSHVLSPEGSLPVTPGNVQLATSFVDGLHGGGGTELMGGLRSAYGIPRKEAGVSRSVVLVTDGYVGVEAQAFKFVREHLGEANLFAFGIGSSVNRGLIEGVARAGLGTPFVVLGPDKAREEADRFQKYIQSPVLTHIEVSFPGFDAREVAPSRVPDVLSQRPVLLFGKYRGDARGRIQVTGLTGGGEYRKVVEIAPALVETENAPIRWLWARKWVELLEDEMNLSQTKELEEAITDLGLRHGLLTSFTSFLAVDSQVVNSGGQSTSVAQPLPLPEGVTDRAVGGSAGLAVHKALSAPMPTSARYDRQRKAEGRALGALPRAPAPARAQVAAEDASAPAPQIVVADVKPAGLADTTDLVRAVEARLARAAQAFGQGRAEVVLKLVIDASGKVTRIEVVKASDKAVAEKLRKLLEGLTSGSRSASGTSSVQIAFKLTGRA
jgi:Ca-activated chloride channel family protein